MKKILLSLILIFASATALAAGPHDGIWSATIDGKVMSLFSVHENADRTVVVIDLSTDLNGWGAASGVRKSGLWDIVKIRTIPGFGGVDIDAQIDFTSLGEAGVEVKSCNPKPGWSCKFPVNKLFWVYKIF